MLKPHFISRCCLFLSLILGQSVFAEPIWPNINLSGNFHSGCLPNGKSHHYYTLTIDDSIGLITMNDYFSAVSGACPVPLISGYDALFTVSFSYQKSTSQQMLNLNNPQARVTSIDSDGANALNSLKMCAKQDWQVGNSVTDCQEFIYMMGQMWGVTTTSTCLNLNMAGNKVQFTKE